MKLVLMKIYYYYYYYFNKIYIYKQVGEIIVIIKVEVIIVITWL